MKKILGESLCYFNTKGHWFIVKQTLNCLFYYKQTIVYSKTICVRIVFNLILTLGTFKLISPD